MAGKYGVEKICKVADFVIDLADSVVKAKKSDGKINVKDYPLFLDDLLAIPGTLSASKGAVNELKEMDTEDREAVKSHVAAKFDIDNEKAEKLVEKSINVVVDATGMINGIDELIEAIKEIKQ